MTLFDVLYEEWQATDMAAVQAWTRLRQRKEAPCASGDELLVAIRLQLEADELVRALRVQLRKERQQVPLI